MEVYNKGSKPIVYHRDYDGVQCIHPGKHLTFGEDEGKKLIAKFENAVSKEDYDKIIEKQKKIKESLEKSKKDK